MKWDDGMFFAAEGCLIYRKARSASATATQ